MIVRLLTGFVRGGQPLPAENESIVAFSVPVKTNFEATLSSSVKLTSRWPTAMRPALPLDLHRSDKACTSSRRL